jgi:hypothetical protein
MLRLATSTCADAQVRLHSLKTSTLLLRQLRIEPS